MNTENQVPQKPSFGRQMWLAFKNLAWFVFRFLLVVVIIAAIGVAIYLGGPILINEYLLKDVKVNSSKITAIQTQIETSDKKMSDRLGDFQNRIGSFEIHQDNLTQSISELEAQLAAIEEKLANQETTLEKMESFEATIENLDSSISILLTQVPIIESEFNGQFADFENTLKNNQEEINKLNTQLEALETTAILRQEIELLKVMELITRARVSIGQENIGLAKNDLQAAIEILKNLRPEFNTEQAVILDDISLRLILAIENISESPDLADEDLEVAWQMLLKGIPEEQPSPKGETTQEVENEIELTPTPTPTKEP